MDNNVRLEYLTALGIDVWVPRAALSKPELEHTDAITTAIESSPQDSWESLNADITQCSLCELCQTRTQSIVGSGSQQAEWLWITEAPSLQEDQQGLPMLGVAGDLFTEMLRAINLSREDVFITNIIKCMTPNNRAPHTNELQHCNGYIQRQIQLIKPKIIIAVGHVAAQVLLNKHATLSELKKSTHEVNNIPLVIINHPAYLLRFLNEKKTAWLDLLHALKLYTEITGEQCGD